MQATRSRAEKPNVGKGVFKSRERKRIEEIFNEHGLPGWLGWGTYGAESSYGTNNGSGFGFGLIEPSYQVKAGTKSPRAGQTYYNAELAAEIYEGLLRTYSLPEAVVKYSGGSYTIKHPFELGGEKAGSYLEEHGGKDTEKTLGEPGLPEVSIPNPLDALSSFLSLITSGEFWIRAMEVVAGGLLVLLALKNLTGAELPSAVPVPV